MAAEVLVFFYLKELQHRTETCPNGPNNTPDPLLGTKKSKPPISATKRPEYVSEVALAPQYRGLICTLSTTKLYPSVLFTAGSD